MEFIVCIKLLRMTNTPETTMEPWGKYLLRTAKNVALAFGGIFVFGIVITFASSGYDELDRNGYIPHDRTLDVYMSDDWLVGENRGCGLILRTDANGKPTGQLDSLVCSMDSSEKHMPHNVSVTFKGIVDPKDTDGNVRPVPEQWKCTRGSNDFTCEPTTKP
jgi:hypothetical protein